jgi:hypothetical protein
MLSILFKPRKKLPAYERLQKDKYGKDFFMQMLHLYYPFISYAAGSLSCHPGNLLASLFAHLYVTKNYTEEQFKRIETEQQTSDYFRNYLAFILEPYRKPGEREDWDIVGLNYVFMQITYNTTESIELFELENGVIRFKKEPIITRDYCISLEPQATRDPLFRAYVDHVHYHLLPANEPLLNDTLDIINRYYALYKEGRQRRRTWL